MTVQMPEPVVSSQVFADLTLLGRLMLPLRETLS